jgi:hypothetical protein
MWLLIPDWSSSIIFLISRILFYFLFLFFCFFFEETLRKYINLNIYLHFFDVFGDWGLRIEGWGFIFPCYLSPFRAYERENLLRSEARHGIKLRINPDKCGDTVLGFSIG